MQVDLQVNKSRILALIFIVLASLLLFSLQSLSVNRNSPPKYGLSSHSYNAGSSEVSDFGWLIPANTLISTTYMTNQSLSNYVVGLVNVFRYQITSGTVLQLGLYVSGALVANQTYDIFSVGGPAAVLINSGKDTSQFTLSFLTYTVTETLANPLTAGSSITVVLVTNLPLWLEIDQSPSIHSYQTSLDSHSSLPSTVSIGNEEIAEHILTVQIE